MPALTDTDIVFLVKAGIGDGLVLEKINSSVCNFRVEPSDLVKLHRAGVSDVIVGVMMRAVHTTNSSTK
jgi:hypothetical protein